MGKFFQSDNKDLRELLYQIECKILTTHQKKGNKRPYWLVKNTPHLRLWFEREHLIQLTDNCEWKAQNLRGKGRKSKPNELVSLKIVLKVKDPKLARDLIVQNNVYASVQTDCGELAKIFSLHLVYAWLSRTYIGQARALCYKRYLDC